MADWHAHEGPDEEQDEHDPGCNAHPKGPLELLLPVITQQGSHTEAGTNHHGNHEDDEAGIDQVHGNLQHHRISTAKKPDVVDCAGEGCKKDQTEGAGVRNGQPAAGFGFDCADK